MSNPLHVGALGADIRDDGRSGARRQWQTRRETGTQRHGSAAGRSAGPPKEPRMRRFVVALCCFAGLAIPAQAAAATGLASHTRLALDTAASFPSYSTTASHQRYVVLNPWQTDRLAALKAANPNVKVLEYKDLSAISSSNNGGSYPSGVGYGEANTAHPDWFLLNTSGQRFTFNGYSWLWPADIGNPSYQNQWA